MTGPYIVVGGTLLVAAAMAAAFFFWLAGSVVVVDRSGGVVTAVVSNDAWQQRLVRFPGGVFYAIPALEGAVEVRCRGGAHKSWGYVTPHLHTKIHVDGPTSCERVSVAW